MQIQRDVSYLKTDVATLKEKNKNQGAKIDEIHKALLGNGRPGILQEFNMYKGALKILYILWIAAVTILGAIIGIKRW